MSHPLAAISYIRRATGVYHVPFDDAPLVDVCLEQADIRDVRPTDRPLRSAPLLTAPRAARNTFGDCVSNVLRHLTTEEDSGGGAASRLRRLNSSAPTDARLLSPRIASRVACEFYPRSGLFSGIRVKSRGIPRVICGRI